MSDPTYVGDILLIEDNPGDVRLTHEMFTEAGMYGTHYVANDGDDAVDFLHRRGDYGDAPRPNLILLDWYFPNTSGRTVLQAIKRDASLQHIPVVVLTGVLSEFHDLQSEQPGADAYVLKPIEPADLRRIVDEFSLGQELV
ncbi:response regulator receiver protein [Haloterrigena turkmenica DSM 5511]|uniref:Response regulator receiver protein n=1 Tax=Haloterrigena turkmenica (strain ATCC 51198 / DSM 5511 / JCM 9101 / NCIMB 13204 / VKM B-1734 / 4k) TaxID=543526 RepID=D2RPA3_HALTV|nr:response regulator [Haloterrigena turkmenica]ADB60137.1 response regulator receiver protein [Haloterrigena turkmenica DSM 5511]